MPRGKGASKEEVIVIVGAGVFGLSTALELRLRGYRNITVLDRYPPPVPDGSSVDVSRVIRCDYTDPFYARIAREALNEWTTEAWRQHYHNCGFVMASQTQNDPFIAKCKEVLRSQQHPVTNFEGSDELIERYPALKGGMVGSSGYINHIGGWADAAGAIQNLATRCSELEITFVTGPHGTVRSLIIEGGTIRGVRTTTGSIAAARVILATGAWTNQLTDLTFAISSSGQPVGFIQLTPKEASSLSKMPVVINFSSGFFIFPPTPNTHLLKVARHSHGFENEIELTSGNIVSSPKTSSNNAVSSFIPSDADEALRDGLRHILPRFANRTWQRRRLCWYTDTPEGNFVVDDHPNISGLFIAAGGAGHAFKFLPVLGRYIVDCLEDKATEEVRLKWRLRGPDPSQGTMVCNDGSRRGPPRRLLSKTEQAKL